MDIDSKEAPIEDVKDVAIKDAAPEPVKEISPVEKADKPKKTVREDIKDVIKDIKTREATKESSDIEDKILEKPKTGAEVDKLKAEKPIKESKPVIVAPNELPADIKADWEKLSAKVQTALIKREEDLHKKLTTMDEERNFAREMQKTILPYMPLINSSGSTPSKAVTEMFNYAHILQTGSPQSKGQLLWQLAQRWNADMRATPQAMAQPQNQLMTLQQELQQTKQQLAALPDTLKQQQESAKLQSVIESFAADPKNSYYERVKPAMAALLSSGIAKDMPDAYDRACNADPEIRSVLMAEKHKADEAKRLADIKAKSVTARNAAVSVKGSPGLNNSDIPQKPKGSLREELKAQYRAATSH